MKRSELATDDPNARFNEGCLMRVGKSMAVGFGCGIFTGCGMLMWYPDPVRYGYKGTVMPFVQDIGYILRGLRMPIAWSTVVLGTFSGVECLFESLRDPQKESTYVNAMAGGAAAGAVMGLMTKRLDIVSVSALATGLFMGMVEYNGQTTVSNPEHKRFRDSIRMSLKEEETETLKELKKKYPEYKHL